MIKVILQVVLLVAVVAFVVVGLFDFDSEEFKPNKKFFIAFIPLILWVVTMCIVFVPANTVGIKYNAISGTSEDTLPEGVAFKTPLDKIYLIDTTIQERTIEGISTQTKDSQFVTMDINVKYQVEPANAYKVYKGYKTLENLDSNLISNITQRCIEEVTTKYNVIDVLGEQRNTIYKEIEVLLKSKLAEEGVNFKMLTIKDTDAGEQIENAIKAEAVAKKNVEVAEQNKLKAEIEAQTKLIEAEGEAAANQVKTEALTDQILTEMWINKWNGKVPSVVGSDGNYMIPSELLGD